MIVTTSIRPIGRKLFDQGTVIEIADVADMYKVRVDNVHGPDIEDIDLPFADVCRSCNGGTSGIGENTQMLPGARVMIYFIDELKQLPIIMGILKHVERPTNSDDNPADQSVLTTIPISTKNFQGKATIAFIEANPQYSSILSHRKSLTWEFFSKKHTDYKPHIIAGIMGNLLVESTLDPTEFQDFRETHDNRGVGRGIAQWGSKEDGNRWQDCINFASARNVSEYNLILQLEFIHHELQDNFYAGNLLKVSDATEAAITFMRNYERPRKIRSARTFNSTGKYIISKYGSRFRTSADYPEMELEDKRVKLAKAVLIEFTESR